MIKVLPIILLALTYLIDQAYTFFDNDRYNSLGSVSWILDGSHAMPVSWNVKYLSDNVTWVVAVLALYMISLYPTKYNRLAAMLYLLYRFLDIIFYFYNFKTERYWFMFIILGTVMAIVYLKRNAKRNEKATNAR